MELPEWLILLTAPVVIGLSVFLRINLGLIGFVAAFAMGGLILNQPVTETLAGTPIHIVLVLVGLTLMISIATRNGTVDWFVNGMLRLCGGRVILLPIMLYLLGFLTAAFGPGAAPILMLLGAQMALRVNLNPVLIAAMIIHGTQGGAYSPVSPYAIIITGIAEDSGVLVDRLTVFGWVGGFHILLGIAVFLLFRGHRLHSLRVDLGQELESKQPILRKENWNRLATVFGFIVLMVGIVGFQFDAAVLSVCVGVALLLLEKPEHRDKSVNGIEWQIILMVAGILTYVATLRDTGAIMWLAESLIGQASAEIVALVLGYFTSIVTGLASTVGTIGLLFPLAEPLVSSGSIDADRMISFLAICAAVSDISPYSVFGALFVATFLSVQKGDIEEAHPNAGYRTYTRQELIVRLLLYVGAVVLIVPPVAWVALILI